MTEYTLTLTILGKDKISGLFDKLDRGLRSIIQTALGVTVARIFEDVAEAIGRMAAQAINAVSYMQVLQITLGSLSAKELVAMSDGLLTVADVGDQADQMAKDLSHDLGRLAILSPYTLEATSNTFRMMVAFGSTTAQAKQLTSGLLTMGAGLGASNEQIQRMGYNLAQIALQGSITKLDIRQLALAGLDLKAVLKALGNDMGIAIEDHLDFNKALADGTITWQDFVDSFEKYAEDNFAGASEKMARSLYGLKSTISDVFTLTMPQILGPAFEEITGFFSGILDSFLFLYDDPRLVEIGVQLGETVGGWMTPLNGAVDRLNADLQFKGKSIPEAFGSFTNNLFGIGKDIVQGLVEGVLENLPQWTGVAAELLSTFIVNMDEKASMLLSAGAQVLQILIDGLVPQIPTLIDTLLQAVLSLVDVFFTVAPQIVVALAQGIATAIPTLISAVGTILSTVLTSLVNALPTLLGAGVDILEAIANGIIAAVGIFFEYAPTILQGLIDAIIGVLPMLFTLASVLITGLATAFAENAPAFLALATQLILQLVTAILENLTLVMQLAVTLLSSLIGAILEALPMMLEVAVPLLTTLVTAILEQLPMLLQLALDLILYLVEAIVANLPLIIQSGIDLLTALIESIIVNLPMIIAAALEIILALVFGLIDALPDLIDAVFTLMTGIVDAIIGNLDVIIVAAVEIVLALIFGLLEALPDLLIAVGDLIVALFELMTNPTTFNWSDIGKNIVTGLGEGFNSMWSSFKENITLKFQGLIKWAKDLFGIDSPSTVFKGIGMNVMKGFEIGLLDNISMPMDAMSNLSGMTDMFKAGATSQTITNSPTYNVFVQGTENVAEDVMRNHRTMELLYGG